MLMIEWRYFEGVFHLVVDIAFLSVSAYAFYLVRLRRRTEHLVWIVPFLIDNTVSLVYRLYADFLLITGRPWGYADYMGWDLLLKIAHCIAVVGLFGLLGLVRDEAKRVLLHRHQMAEPPEGAWPPPPARQP